MSKIAVVFWSGTGNTEIMANEVAQGIKEKGSEVEVISAENFSKEKVGDFDGIAFGCPAMGEEVLEEEIFEPMFNACEPDLNGKKIALFGSYGWGDGEWMQNWEEKCKGIGAVLTTDCVTCMEEPDDDAKEACRKLGASLA
ncbi:flavodoxin, short chain [Acetitomaculum ruminis DSM 5522]|uniref:Flavodoxin n=1 Tax=Acetitomaculum ruminis DSM 5522 TaxID=1120918 RepID=A0A1I0Y1F8_9FIRM|nr:flavodoxin [Acetitomaculum ruminis]SFB06707.1 flavodoxin, short chain [Acetitomaculum ruminis DSM 5522]